MSDPTTVKVLTESIAAADIEVTLDTDPASGETVVIAQDGDHTYRVTGDDPVKALTELMRQLNFEDLD